MPEEIPELGKFVILSYATGNLSYPVVGCLQNPTVPGYANALPAIGDACPDSLYSATHTFTGVQVASPDGRVWWVYERLPGPTLSGKLLSGEAMGQIATTSAQELAANAADLTPDYKTLSWSDTPLNAAKKRRDIVKLDSGTSFPVVTDYDQDAQMQSLITTTFEIVDASAVSAPSITQGVIKRFKHLDKWRSLKIVETYATPADYSEQKFSGQHFPKLFNAIYADDQCGVFLDSRGDFDAMVEIRIDISFGNYAQVSGLTLIPNTFAMFAFKVTDTLNDAVTLSATGDCTYTLEIPASSPSKSTYEGYGSTLQLVSGECVLWKAGIFRTTKLYVKMI